MTQGLGKGFAPSIDSANKALGNVVEKSVHPGGLAGTNFSLEEMAKRVREGRNDPRVRAWAGKVLIAAGKPTSIRAKAQAILDELRKKTVYEQDPVNSELMAKPHVTLCLDDHGLCMPAADCDDLVICFASAMMSIGVETKIVGASYGTTQATHVLCAVQDPTEGWFRVDPSHASWPVGRAHPATKEWWVDPLSGSVTTGTGSLVTAGKEPEDGDFIGVGAIPFAHAFSPLAHGASYVPVGLESGLPCKPDGTECGDEAVIVEGECQPAPSASSYREAPNVSGKQLNVPPAEPLVRRGMGLFPDDNKRVFR